jgi:hypothetical protein
MGLKAAHLDLIGSISALGKREGAQVFGTTCAPSSEGVGFAVLA